MIGLDDVPDVVLIDVVLDPFDGASGNVVGHDLIDQTVGLVVEADDLFGVSDRAEAGG